MPLQKNEEKRKQEGFRIRPTIMGKLLVIQSMWPKLFGKVQSQSDILEALIDREHESLINAPKSVAPVEKTTPKVEPIIAPKEESNWDDDEI